MVDILHTKFSNAFSWMKWVCFFFQLKFQSIGTQGFNKITQHWFRFSPVQSQWLSCSTTAYGAIRANWVKSNMPNWCRIIMSKTSPHGLFAQFYLCLWSINLAKFSQMTAVDVIRNYDNGHNDVGGYERWSEIHRWGADWGSRVDINLSYLNSL